MMDLSDSERIQMIRYAVLIQYTLVTDRQTDRQTDGIGVAYTRYIYALYSIYALARKNRKERFVPGGARDGKGEVRNHGMNG